MDIVHFYTSVVGFTDLLSFSTVIVPFVNGIYHYAIGKRIVVEILVVVVVVAAAATTVLV